MTRKLISFLTTCMMVLTVWSIPVSTFATGEGEEDGGTVDKIITGDLSVYNTRPSANEVRARYAALPQEPGMDDLFETEADLDAYTPAVMTDEAYNYAESLINLYRYQAGVRDITLDSVLNENSAQGALILAKLGQGLTHYPETPEGVTDEQAKPGKFATESSNISISSPDKKIITWMLYGQMADDDSNNMNKVGHRRWLLYPNTKTMGIGMASNASKKQYYTAVRIRTSNISENYDEAYGKVQTIKGRTYNAITWPNSGYVLNNMFDPYTPWSATIYQNKYGWAQLSDVSVTVTRQIDGKSWTMDESDSFGNSGEKYFNVNKQGYGLNNCIIFNPGVENLGTDPLIGTYTVEIDGLPNEAENGPIVYDVTFIDPVKKSIDELNVTTKNKAFTGEDITDDVVTVKDGDKVLQEGTDYTLSFENNNDIGTATVTISGKGNYVGATKATFDIAEVDHVWGKGVVTTQPTCKDEGEMTYTCKGCGATKTGPVPADESKHSWELGDTITPATCTQKGIVKAECSICGAETTLPLVKDLNNHDSWNEGVVTKQPTCKDEGEMTYTCACGATRTEPIPSTPNDHAWNNGELVNEGSCLRDGQVVYTCTVCGAERTETITGNRDNHENWNDGEVTAPASCTEDGEMTYTCECGATRTEAIPAEGHHFGAWSIVKMSTCSVAGYKERICIDCDYTETKGLALSDHTWADTETIDKEPTCTANGSKSIHCLNCNARTSSVIIPALGHKWNSGTVTKKPTCTASGTKTFKCTRCGATRTESIQALGHKWTHVKNPAGHLKNGSEYDQCSVCGLKKNVVTLYGYSTNYVSSLKLSKASKAFTAKWKKQSKANRKKFNGYQVRYSTSANMVGAKSVTAGNSSKSKKIKSLAKKKVYYVQVRTYTKSGGTTFYSSWTTVKSVKTK